jgi:pSer/pThr/pTyr-binding forkhead associated (FHA) protein
MSGFIQIAMSPAPERRFRSAAEMIKAMRTQHTVSQSPRPSINVGGVTFELRSPAVDVGRQHVCDGSCKSLGYTNQNQIRITDPQKFIEKHHARIWVDSSGQCYLEDLGSTNRTAVKHTEGTDEFRVLKAFEKEKLEDQDVVALAYGQARGPYVTFTFRVGPGSER